METNQIWEDDCETNTNITNATFKARRSSILKAQKQKTLCDLDTTDTTQQITRRVSFASSNFVKPFVSDPEKNTIWDNTYEEVLNHSDTPKNVDVDAMHTFRSAVQITGKNETILFDSDDMEFTCRLAEEKENIGLPVLMEAQTRDNSLYSHDSKAVQSIYEIVDMDFTVISCDKENNLQPIERLIVEAQPDRTIKKSENDEIVQPNVFTNLLNNLVEPEDIVIEKDATSDHSVQDKEIALRYSNKIEIYEDLTTELKIVQLPSDTEQKIETNQTDTSAMMINVNETVSHGGSKEKIPDLPNFGIHEESLLSQIEMVPNSDTPLVEEECSLVNSLNLSGNVSLNVSLSAPQCLGGPVSPVIYSEPMKIPKPLTPLPDVMNDLEYSHSVTSIDTTRSLMDRIKLLDNESSLDVTNKLSPFLEIVRDKLVKFECSPINFEEHERELKSSSLLYEKITSVLDSIKFPKLKSIRLDKIDKQYSDENISSNDQLEESFFMEANTKHLDLSMVMEKISDISSRSRECLVLKDMEENAFNFSMLYGACYMMVKVNLKTFEVFNLKTFNCTKEQSTLVDLNIEQFLKKLSKNNLKSFLGPHFDLVSLLDYTFITMEELVNNIGI